MAHFKLKNSSTILLFRHQFSTFKKRKISAFSAVILSLFLLASPLTLLSQDRVLFMNEGRLWETLNLSKIGPTFSNWARSGYGMDYPGYEPDWIPSHTGEAPSHHVGGGFWIGALNDSGYVKGREDFAIYAGSVGYESTSKYIASVNRFKYPDKTNYFQQLSSNEGELSAETIFQWNPNYLDPYTIKRYLPIKVTRNVHQWVTHEIDQDYIIIDYTIKNVGDSTMHKTYVMFLYGFSINARGWSVVFPGYNSGARNNRMAWDNTNRMMYGYAADFPEVTGNQSYDFDAKSGPDQTGEYLAPAYAGLKFLYISPDSSGRVNRINKYGWAASHPTQASIPFTNKNSVELEYAVLRDPYQATDAITFMGDSRWQSSRIWTMVSLGPWDLAPGDSIRIAVAEVVGCVDYKIVVDPTTTSTQIAKGKQILVNLAKRAQDNFDTKYNIPDPPAAPSEITLSHLSEKQVGNVIKWSDAGESIPDADYTGDEAFDLYGYRVYRSSYLPIGPWDTIGVVLKSDPNFFDSMTNQYTYIDTNVTMGAAYYYAVTAFDAGHASWLPNPSLYPTGVPSQESSKYVNMTTRSFRTGLRASEDLSKVIVVPNPFVIASGWTTPGDEDLIQFINVPSPCVIRIYTVRGEVVKEIHHTEDIGTATWDQVTEWGQYVESGVYIYYIESKSPTSKGKTLVGKFSIIR